MTSQFILIAKSLCAHHKSNKMNIYFHTLRNINNKVPKYHSKLVKNFLLLDLILDFLLGSLFTFFSLSLLITFCIIFLRMRVFPFNAVSPSLNLEAIFSIMPILLALPFIVLYFLLSALKFRNYSSASS